MRKRLLLSTVLVSLSFHSVQAAPAGSLVKQQITPAVSGFIDQKIKQFTKAKCIMSYRYEIIESAPSKGLTSQRLFEEAYKATVASFNKSKNLGQAFDSGKSGKSFWLVSNSQLAGSAFIYSQYDDKFLSLYSCKSSF